MTDRDLLKLCAEVLPKYKDDAWEDELDDIRCDVDFLRRYIDKHLRETDASALTKAKETKAHKDHLKRFEASK